MNNTRIVVATVEDGFGLLKGEILGNSDIFSTLCLVVFMLIVCLVFLASFTRSVSLLWRERSMGQREQHAYQPSEPIRKPSIPTARTI